MYSCISRPTFCSGKDWKQPGYFETLWMELYHSKEYEELAIKLDLRSSFKVDVDISQKQMDQFGVLNVAG
jgi:hypothetical protein